MVSEAKREQVRQALEAATIAVQDVPEPLRATAFAEAFKAFFGGEGQGDRDGLRLPGDRADAETSIHAPATVSPAVVSDKGKLLEKAIWAIGRLQSSGEPATQPAIARVVKDELATATVDASFRKILVQSTPRYFLRQKEGRGYVYSTTDAGLARLAALTDESQVR